MERILFVCIGNICRSPIAAAIARERLRNRARVESAGIGALDGLPATAEAIEAARERGLELATHRARSVYDLDLDAFDRIVALTASIAAHLVESCGVAPDRLITLEIADPYGQQIDAYRDCLVRLDEALGDLFAEVEAKADAGSPKR